MYITKRNDFSVTISFDQLIYLGVVAICIYWQPMGTPILYSYIITIIILLAKDSHQHIVTKIIKPNYTYLFFY